jgi:PAS domain S-box-containing protein
MSSPGTAPEIDRAESMHVVKLLLVDDDQDNLLALQAILEPLGQQLVLASTGLEALKLCLDQDFAAILLDVRMPGMDGFETAQMIRNRRRSSQTPILFLTAYRSDEQLFRGYNLGAVDFLFKPIVPEVLQSKVSVFVELSRKEQLLRKQTETISKAERKLRALLEAAPDAMVVTDGAGVIELTNSRADTLFGYGRESLVGANILSLIPAWQRPEPIGGSWHHPPCLEQRLSAARRDGTAFPADVTASACHTPDGVFFTTAVRDATDQVLAENRIQKLNTELEARVQERTRALSRSNEALRQFAWAASHDLQEPVRTVVAYSEWLHSSTENALGDRESRMLGVIRQHGERLHRLLGALREYIRVSESGSQEPTRVDSRAAAATAAAALQSLIEESGATIEYGELPTVDSIEILMVQLFQNLIGNAIKYRGAQPPRIRVSAAKEDHGWTFAVEDNGVGIESKHFVYIFGVFRRLQGGENPGTGVGLAICKAAVERLGGRIWVESTPGAGSTFRFFLPQGMNSNETAKSISG